MSRDMRSCTIVQQRHASAQARLLAATMRAQQQRRQRPLRRNPQPFNKTGQPG
ncbi:MAG: hypothetical protein NTV22_20060 [bacterium]|nr:hypothetical protein [bacterium]